MNTGSNIQDARGYEKLTVNGYDTINGIMLADEKGYHPLVNEKSLEVLNSGNNKNIRYYWGKYGFKGEVYKI